MSLKKWIPMCCLCVVFVLVAVVVVMNFLGKHSIEPLVPCNGVPAGENCYVKDSNGKGIHGQCKTYGNGNDLKCVVP